MGFFSSGVGIRGDVKYFQAGAEARLGQTFRLFPHAHPPLSGRHLARRVAASRGCVNWCPHIWNLADERIRAASVPGLPVTAWTDQEVVASDMLVCPVEDTNLWIVGVSHSRTRSIQ